MCRGIGSSARSDINEMEASQTLGTAEWLTGCRKGSSLPRPTDWVPRWTLAVGRQYVMAISWI
jgi:hypothetical protein